MALIVVVAVLVVIAGFLVAIYNGLVQLRVRADNAWSDIDVQLKRRHDLIPNLVETVKGYAAHERETLENVIRARNQATAAHSPHEAQVDPLSPAGRHARLAGWGTAPPAARRMAERITGGLERVLDLRLRPAR